ncbi:LPXTG cell wall anchor domain-containing protein, partial [Staphylococcus aureus]
AYVVGGTPIDENPAPTTDPTPTPTPTPSSTPTPTTSASATPAWATRTGSLASTGTEAPWPLALIGGILILLAAGAFALRHRRG